MAQLLRQILNDAPEQRLCSPEQLQQALDRALPVQPTTAPASLQAESRLKDAAPQPLAEVFEADQPVVPSPATGPTLGRRVPMWKSLTAALR